MVLAVKKKKSNAIPKMRIAFVDEYLRTGNAADAYRNAFNSKALPPTVAQHAKKLLKDPFVAAMIEDAQRKILEKNPMSVDDVFKNWCDIATADVNDLMQLRRNCCRYCWGVNNEYQWTQAEYRRAQTFAIQSGKEAPEMMGGFGYNANKPVNPGCTECFGKGTAEVYLQDTRTLVGKAKALYAGVKQTSNGIEIQMRDQSKALSEIARFLGMFTDKLEITGKDGKPIQSISSLTVDPIEAAKLYQSFMGGS